MTWSNPWQFYCGEKFLCLSCYELFHDLMKNFTSDVKYPISCRNAQCCFARLHAKWCDGMMLATVLSRSGVAWSKFNIGKIRSKLVPRTSLRCAHKLCQQIANKKHSFSCLLQNQLRTKRRLDSTSRD